ncbi:hypothetical protein [Thiolapillus brandeum]|uniref:Uncharacterized protein n=1 Tax=Thiolapillus brandeum TaxID=1076588 RepID=A0A7U6JHK9_9GAMM|nr:hypothetical protein [Thiolapillus brandeum]BAO43897.1 conserved hypothetical protein [Thiolapillus brandeum]
MEDISMGEIIEAEAQDQESPDVSTVPVQNQTASPLDLPAEVFRAGLHRRKENRAALMEWVGDALVEGSDYGRIHVVGKNKCPHGNRCTNPAHFSKPSLFKPGAEKICGMLGITVHFPTLHDYEQAALHGVELHHIIVRCELHDASGHVVADGVGARSLKQDYGDINKALKMAEKSAHIDATLRMAGLSEVFTQDLEDMKPEPAASSSHSQKAGAPNRQAAPVRQNAAPITQAQHKRLEARISELGLDRERVKAWVSKAWNIKHLNEIPKNKYSDLDKRLGAWVQAMAEEEAQEERSAIQAGDAA